jgi:hypothetical protein
MPKILFCETDMSGFREKEADILSNFQLTGLMRNLPDILGLKSWEEYKNMDFSNYDLIWIHLNPRVMYPAWYDYPKLIRDRAPNTIIVASHEYDPVFFQQDYGFIDETTLRGEISYVLKRAFSYLDYWVSDSKFAWEILSKMLDIPVLYAHISQPQLEERGWLNPLPWNEREGIVTISHSIILPLNRKFHVMKDTQLPSTIITTNKVDKPASLLRDDALSVLGNSSVRCYDTLPWFEYLDIIRHARVAFDMDYTGICRFSYECAKLGVPVVGSSLMEYRTMLYPELTVSKYEDYVITIKRIYNDELETQRLNSYANTIIREYWSTKAVEQRTKRLLEKMGVSF